MDRWFKIILVTLVFILAGTLFIHSFTSINQDIGRHLKLGEIIWTTHHIPTTNLFSFTEPDHPFINHHWLSEVVLYLINQFAGLEGIIIAKAIVLLIAYWLLFCSVPKAPLSWKIGAMLFSLFIIYDRSEARPEILSFLFLAVFLLVLYRVRLGEFSSRALWILPFIELLWVNSHIYFFVGLIVYGCFLFERILQHRFNRQELLIGVALGCATLINPHGIYGALYPLNVFKEYGYDVVENKSIYFLINYFGHWSFHFKVFFASIIPLVVGFVVNIRNLKNKIFELALSTFLVYAAVTMMRNLALYAIASMPILISLFDFPATQITIPKRLRPFVGIGAIFILIALISSVISNHFYDYIQSRKRFGLDIPDGAEHAVQFIKDNHIQGPVFDDFDVGSYLIWKLYPEQRVFADGRPEAYSVHFWNDIYKPMQADYAVWQKKSNEYNINYIFFSTSDQTEWSRAFFKNLSRDPQWPIVFLDDDIVIFLRRTPANQAMIDRYAITRDTISVQLPEIMTTLNTTDDGSYRKLATFLYAVGWFQACSQVYDQLIHLLPHDPYAYQGKAYCLVSINTIKANIEALPVLEKAIDLGMQTVDNYILLAMMQANIGHIPEAQVAIQRALLLDSSNERALQIEQQLSR